MDGPGPSESSLLSVRPLDVEVVDGIGFSRCGINSGGPGESSLLSAWSLIVEVMGGIGFSGS